MAEGRATAPKIPSRAALARKWPRLRVNRYTGRWVDDATGRGGDDLVSLAGYLRERPRARAKSKPHTDGGEGAPNVEDRDTIRDLDDDRPL